MSHPCLFTLLFLAALAGFWIYRQRALITSWLARFRSDSQISAAVRRLYSWRPQLPDLRDHVFTAGVPRAQLPTAVDLTGLCPAVYDQGSLGDCVGNNVAFAIQFDEMRQRLAAGVEVPSRLFIYWNARATEGTTKVDAGCFIRDAVKGVSKLGVCAESLWPYVVARFAVKPSKAAFAAALKETAVTYQAVAQSLDGLRGAVAAGFPVVLGVVVYQSFEGADVARTGRVPLPGKTEKVLGGHCVSVVGYDDERRLFKIRNSWSATWGDQGYGYLDYDYLTNPQLCSDCWVIQKVK